MNRVVNRFNRYSGQMGDEKPGDFFFHLGYQAKRQMMFWLVRQTCTKLDLEYQVKLVAALLLEERNVSVIMLLLLVVVYK